VAGSRAAFWESGRTRSHPTLSLPHERSVVVVLGYRMAELSKCCAVNTHKKAPPERGLEEPYDPAQTLGWSFFRARSQIASMSSVTA
jgi:hypothetical protein